MGGTAETQYFGIGITFYHPSPDWIMASSVLVGGANTVGPSFGAAATRAAAATTAVFSVGGNNKTMLPTTTDSPSTLPSTT